MNFAEAYELRIGDHVEKKGKFSYLSWAYAVRFLRENFPDATWTIHENEHGLPVFSIGDSHFVKITVTLGTQGFTQWHPILDQRNQPIKEPSSFHINTSIQRGLTKAIGLATGIGLGLYAGEDLPTDEQPKEDDKKASSQSAYDVLLDWIDKVSQKPECKDPEVFKNWWINDENKKLIEKKQELSPEDLQRINRQFEQMHQFITDQSKKAA